MKNDKYMEYRLGKTPPKIENRLWPLYGAGLENLGLNDKPIDVSMPAFGPDELLVRHDACGLCFSDVKIIRLGEDHPRIYRDMQKEPVVMGHEVSMTVVGVGENLKDQYKPGDRFIIQADIFIDGVGYAYGYEIQGGLSQYNVIDQRILNGDDGNYLIPIRTQTGYAESALVEPWACVIAAYHLKYREELKNDGIAWFIGPENGEYSISAGFDIHSHPSMIKLTRMDGPFGNWLVEQAEKFDIKVEIVNEIPEVAEGREDLESVDDIVLLSPSSELIEKVSPFLAFKGVLAISTTEDLERPVNIDVGRIHYNRWIYIGGTQKDIAEIYQHVPVRSSLKKGGTAFFVGAGGPMGRMHVQHAIEANEPPGIIVCSDVSDLRLNDLDESFASDARAKGIEWICVNPSNPDTYIEEMKRFEENGFDDIIMLAPIPKVISDTSKWLGRNGVMNIFAGVARGTTAVLNINETIFKDVRIIGHSASSIEDMLLMLNDVESGQLSSNRSVAAVGSLDAVKDGLKALIDFIYPGKVVIFPNIKPFPLTSLLDLEKSLPNVFAKLRNGREWTNAAEEEFLKTLLE